MAHGAEGPALLLRLQNEALHVVRRLWVEDLGLYQEAVMYVDANRTSAPRHLMMQHSHDWRAANPPRQRTCTLYIV